MIKTNYFQEKDRDILKDIQKLSYDVFKKYENGEKLLQALFDYHLCYLSPSRNGVSTDAIQYEIGGQDMIRMLHNYAIQGENLIKNGE